MTVERWIDCECPVTGVDFDVFEIVGPDATVRCSECGGEHRAADIGQLLESHAGSDTIRLSEAEWLAILKRPLASARLMRPTRNGGAAQRRD